MIASAAMRTPRTKLGNIGLTLFSRLGFDTGYRKIFVIGLADCGTSEVTQVLSSFGMVTADGRDFRHSFSAWPVQLGYAEHPKLRTLTRRHPDALFVLATMDLIDWLHTQLSNVSLHDDALVESLRARERFHFSVLTHFAEKPSRLLVTNYIRDPGKAARDMAAFVACPSPSVFPVSPREGRAHQPAHQAQIERCLRRVGVFPYEWTHDLLYVNLSGSRFPTDSTQR